ncbi:MAG: TIGR02710 family CRISPR-associated CARF protein [Gammaproteobacteria bacterium]|nr:TIGR02710 family CRISPR-associated CARF protein [Gammaproteobacteria bacterium]
MPADDLDGAVLALQGKLAELCERFPGAAFVADYTGGTKTMSAALVCAALEREDVDLQLVLGTRADLVKVKSGTEQTAAASAVRTRLQRRMAPCLGAWKRYAYAEAAEGLRSICISSGSPDLARLNVARNLSAALARWDAFDHVGALDLLDDYGARTAPVWPTLLPTLRNLTCKDNPRTGKRNPRQEPARLWDLWRNAERRATQGRFDDAVARLYRLIEWTAQWQLDTKRGWKTAHFPAEELPKTVSATAGPDGKIKLGLWHAWRVAAEQLGEPIAGVVTGGAGEELRDLLDLRNRSILAHGFSPVRESDWRRMQKWMSERFLPVLDRLSAEEGLKERPPQLPTELLAIVLEPV